MKKRTWFKKLAAVTTLVLAVTTIIGNSCLADAKTLQKDNTRNTNSCNHNDDQDSEDLQNIEPRYVVSCPSGGKHYMQSNGWADVYNGVYPNGTLKWRNVPKYQCKYCNVLIVTRYEVNASRAIGDYTIWHTQEPQPTFTVLYTTNFYYEPSKTLSGYEFH